MIRTFITHAALVCAALFAGTVWAATDVNKASQAELESVKGIGPGLASKMLKARETGAFKDWSDLVDRVAGVGPGNAARFSQAGLTVAGAAYTSQAAGAQVKAGAKAPGAKLEAATTPAPAAAPAPAAKGERARKNNPVPAAV